MPNPTSLLPPRNLYKMLRACTTPDARARMALGFLRNGAGSQSGFLFQPKNGQLVVTASTNNQPPPAGMLEDAQRAFDELSNSALDDMQATGVRISSSAALRAPEPLWHAPDGTIFERRGLGTHRAHQWTLVGLVMLRRDGSEPLQPIRHTYVTAICEAMIEAGDL
jgi:hypothetical protein